MEENKVRTTVDDLITQAEQQYVEFLKSGKYKDLLLSMSNLNCYSLNNHLLILSQMPTATCVNGMKVWNYYNRKINKGEKSIKIIAPVKESKEVQVLNEQGRLAIITFHSLEDRAVKEAFIEAEGKCTCPKDLPYCVCGCVSYGKIITRKPIIPTKEEEEENSRSKSAKLRIFERREKEKR